MLLNSWELREVLGLRVLPVFCQAATNAFLFVRFPSTWELWLRDSPLISTLCGSEDMDQ